MITWLVVSIDFSVVYYPAVVVVRCVCERGRGENERNRERKREREREREREERYPIRYVVNTFPL